MARSAPSAFPDKQAARMPRYFFNMMEGRSHNLVRDIDGVQLADLDEAREEAIGLAQDITSHGLSESMQTWTVVVTDEGGAEVLTVPLAQISTRKAQAPHAAGHAISRGLVRLESCLGRAAVIWITAAVALAIVLPAAFTKMRMAQDSGYQTASAELGVSEGALVAVRFRPEASIAEINKFLAVYDGSMAGGPSAGDLYRVRIGDASLPAAELAKLTRRMAQEQVVEFVAAVE
jgi:hypothetical protein